MDLGDFESKNIACGAQLIVGINLFGSSSE
jgi:hypothetical protein